MNHTQTDNEAPAKKVIQQAPRIALYVLIGIIIVHLFISVLTGSAPADFFARMGQIGDVTGGVTGPILNFGGMLIVYYSLREQLRANAIQNDALKIQNEALQKELQRTHVESLMKSTTQLVEICKSRIIELDRAFRGVKEAVANYQNPSIKAFANPDGSTISKRDILEHSDKRFEELFSLFTLIMSKLEDNSFPIEEKLYAANRFYEECIVLFNKHSYRPFIPEGLVSDINPKLYIDAIAYKAEAFERIRKEIYNKVLEPFPKVR